MTDSTTSSSSVVAVIDLAPWTEPTIYSDDDRHVIVDRVAMACRDIGFLAVTNHGIDESIIQNMLMASRSFFDLPTIEKLSHKSDDETTYPYGYENSENLARGKQIENGGMTAAEAAPPSTKVAPTDTTTTTTAAPPPRPPPPSSMDWKETFCIGPDDPNSGMPARRIPTNPPTLAPALTSYYTAMEGLAAVLLEIFARALGLPADWFASSRMDHHVSALSFLNYFPVEDPAAVPPGQLRASAHTDYGPLTILYSGGPGLQVHQPNGGGSDDGGDDDGSVKWVDVPDLPGALIVNLGDLMQRWTNDRWRSTLHRVVIKGEGARRQSMAYFCNVNGDCLVDPADLLLFGRNGEMAHYPPVTAREHLMAKHLASMGRQ